MESFELGHETEFENAVRLMGLPRTVTHCGNGRGPRRKVTGMSCVELSACFRVQKEVLGEGCSAEP